MAKKRFAFLGIEADEKSDRPFYSPAFLQNYMAALLLPLLGKNLLTQRQFDRCIEELQKLPQ